MNEDDFKEKVTTRVTQKSEISVTLFGSRSWALWDQNVDIVDLKVLCESS